MTWNILCPNCNSENETTATQTGKECDSCGKYWIFPDNPAQPVSEQYDWSTYYERSKTHLTPEQLAEFIHCPLLMQKRRSGLIPSSNKSGGVSRDVKRGVRCLVLEGDAAFYEKFTADAPINKSTGKPYGNNTKAYAEWAESHEKTVITGDELTKILAMAESVREKDAFKPHMPVSRVFTGEVDGVACQCVFDAIDATATPPTGYQLRTISNLDDFEARMRKYQYVIQSELRRAISGVGSQIEVAVESREPYRCGVWVISSNGLLNSAISSYKSSQSANWWPTGYESVSMFYG